jgi:elongation factor P hydroxylase
LQGGASEPLYLPASAGRDAIIFYRADYAASALHEVAHWCIAGAERRRREDYGYWYIPDGRDAAQQRAFQQAEQQPQALEWHFARAAGVPFRISLDNLAASTDDGPAFAAAVAAQAQRLCQTGLPPRAESFRRALASRFGGVAAPAPDSFTLAALST